MKATLGHRFLGFSTNSVRQGFYPTFFTINLRALLMFRLVEALNDRLIGPKTWDRSVRIYGAHLGSP